MMRLEFRVPLKMLGVDCQIHALGGARSVAIRRERTLNFS